MRILVRHTDLGPGAVYLQSECNYSPHSYNVRPYYAHQAPTAEKHEADATFRGDGFALYDPFLCR